MERTRKLRLYIAALIALAVFIVYLPALRNEFVNWDDGPYVFANFHIRTLDLAFFRWAFLSFHASNWHPLTWISHAVDYSVWGLNPLGHHLTSIILHALNTFLVALLVVRLLETLKEKTAGTEAPKFLNERVILITAGTTALLFGLHPVHVESIAWVAERKDLLCALFVLLSLLAYTGYAIAGAAGKPFRNFKYYLFSLGLFVLALLSKPMAVTLPVVLLILDWHPLERLRSRREFRTSLLEKIPFFALSIISSIITILAQKAGDAVSSLDSVPLLTRLLVAAKALVVYLGNMMLPLNLIPFYPYPRDAALLSPEYLFALALAAGISGACAAFAGKQKFWLAAWFYYVITLIPVLGIVQVGSQAMADRYTYLPSIGPFMLAGLGAAWVDAKVQVMKPGSRIKAVPAVVSMFLIVSLSALTIGQTGVWRNSVGLWTTVVERGVMDSSLVYVNRGIAFEKAGLLDKAVRDLERALFLDPASYRAYISLGAVYEKMGRLAESEEIVNQAIALNPLSHEAFRNRGVVHEKMGRHAEALSDYTRAISLNPVFSEAYNHRGLTFARMGQFEKAIADYDETIRINPRHFGVYQNRGITYAVIGQLDKALDDFNAAVRLDQKDPVAYFNRASFYRRTGRNDLAFSDFRKACDLGNGQACTLLQTMQ